MNNKLSTKEFLQQMSEQSTHSSEKKEERLSTRELEARILYEIINQYKKILDKQEGSEGKMVKYSQKIIEDQKGGFSLLFERLVQVEDICKSQSILLKNALIFLLITILILALLIILTFYFLR